MDEERISGSGQEQAAENETNEFELDDSLDRLFSELRPIPEKIRDQLLDGAVEEANLDIGVNDVLSFVTTGFWSALGSMLAPILAVFVRADNSKQ